MTQGKRKTSGLLVTLAMAASVALPIGAWADAGSYLATRQAMFDRDFRTMTDYAARYLVSDMENAALLESAISGYISQGDIKGAVAYATILQKISAGNQLAGMAILATRADEGDFAGLIAALDDGVGISAPVDLMLRAWGLVGAGDVSAALDVFDEAGSAGQGFEFLGPYNKSLALALVGDYESAAEVLEAAAGNDTARGLLARVQMLSQLERFDEAETLLQETFGDASDPVLDDMRAALAARQPIPFDIVTSAKEGMADVFNSVALALDGGLDDAYVLLYARLAQALRPEMDDYALTVAQLLERLDNYELASEVYETIPQSSPSFVRAELGRAEALRALGNEDAEAEVLKQLVKTRPEEAGAHIALGDGMRRRERYEEAIEAYTNALALLPDDAARLWPIYFTRGIAYERSDRWPEAEADLRKALDLNPGQPQVLNYLGYSFLEMRTNLDEAMEMIREAVEARPQDGYITDSLAWGLYRLRRFDEAVEPMERAVELMPVDPIVNDHLGDVYWAVGREREAIFQWRRAQSFDPEPEDAERIRRKLDIGLDRVLIEEGEEPTRPVTSSRP